MCISHGNASRSLKSGEVNWRKGDSKATDPCYTALPGVGGRWERSFCHCHNEERGRGLPGGYMERKVDELTVIVKKGRVRRSVRKERVE